jgi:hypothetical protein
MIPSRDAISELITIFPEVNEGTALRILEVRHFARLNFSQLILTHYVIKGAESIDDAINQYLEAGIKLQRQLFQTK